MSQEEQWILNEKYHGEKTKDFFIDCKRLKTGEPLAYIIGHLPFLHTTIYLDSHPLIPRVETEFWVEKVIHEIHTHARSRIKILDLCAGSGCIGVAILDAIKNVSIDFVELDQTHHTTIKKNLTQNDIKLNRACIIGGDLFENVRDTYDYIVTNPPYVEEHSNRTDKNVLAFEPYQALNGGASGLEIIAKIIPSLRQYLKNGGMCFMEHEPEQTTYIHKKAEQNSLYSSTHNDQFGILRYTCFKNDL